MRSPAGTGYATLSTTAASKSIPMLSSEHAGSDGGAEHWAIIASLIETCKLAGVDPCPYLSEIITKIVNGHPNSRLDELLPWAYHAANPLRNVA